MRVFTFFLMMTVALGGTLVGYRAITGKDLVDPADFGLGRTSVNPVPASTPAVPHSPSATATAAPTSPPSTPTPAPDLPQAMVVGNTDGQGVFLRRTPRIEDRLRAWNDGTRMEIIGMVVVSEGRNWRKVRAPDGVEGYIPEEFLVERR